MKKLFLLINIFTSLTIFGQDISKGLIAYYPFNENSKDESGNGNDGTVYGARLTSDRKGNINSAFSFNGYSDYIKIEDKPELSNISTISVSLWVKKESHSNDYEGIVTKWYQLASNTSRRHQDCYGIYYNKNAINGFTNNYGTVNKFIFATAMVSSWHHIVFEHSSSSGGKLYIDGRLQGVLGVYGQISNSTNPVIIGADNAGGKIWRFFNGVIDDVRIYNRTLSETEIAELYNDGGTTSNTNISQNSNSNNVNIYESLKKFDCYTSVTPEIYNIKT